MLSFRTLRRHTRNNWFLRQALMVVTAVNVPKSKFPQSVRTQINNRILTICHSLEPEETSNSAIDCNLINQINIAILGLQLPASGDTVEVEIPLKKIDKFIIAATNTANLLKDGHLKCYELFFGQKLDESDETILHPLEEKINTRGRKKVKFENSKGVNQVPVTPSANNIESDGNYYRTSSQLLQDLLSDTEDELTQTNGIIIPRVTLEHSTFEESSTQTTGAEIQNLFSKGVNDNTTNVKKTRLRQPRDFINFNNFNSCKWRKFDDDYRSDLDDHVLNYNTIVHSYLESSDLLTDLSQMTTSSGYDSLSSASSDTLSASLSSIDLSDSESLMSPISSNSSMEFKYDYNFDIDLGILMDQDSAIFDSDLF